MADVTTDTEDELHEDLNPNTEPHDLQRCPHCGYTELDKLIHGDHRICEERYPVPRPEPATVDTTEDDLRRVEGKWTSMDNMIFAKRYPDKWIDEAREVIPRLAASLRTSRSRIAEVEAMNAEQWQWRMEQIRGLAGMARRLIEAGFKGDGINEGIDWLVSERDTARAEAAAVRPTREVRAMAESMLRTAFPSSNVHDVARFVLSLPVAG